MKDCVHCTMDQVKSYVIHTCTVTCIPSTHVATEMYTTWYTEATCVQFTMLSYRYSTGFTITDSFSSYPHN